MCMMFHEYFGEYGEDCGGGGFSGGGDGGGIKPTTTSINTTTTSNITNGNTKYTIK